MIKYCYKQCLYIYILNETVKKYHLLENMTVIGYYLLESIAVIGYFRCELCTRSIHCLVDG